MIRETLCRTEILYSAGKSIADAKERMDYPGGPGGSDTPQEAWNDLPYFDREENASEFEVYEFKTETTVVKILPPYTAR